MLSFKPVLILSLSISLQVAWCANNGWDYITFSQSWPATTCTVWKQRNQSNSCSFPSDPSLWTVHGIWPSKTGQTDSNYCPNKLRFDENQLKPMLDDLKKYWTDVHASKEPYSFWKYQWQKHGTCGTNSPELNGVEKYFRQGLEWNHKYKLSSILAKSGIVPGPVGFTPQKLAQAIKAATNANPRIQCETDKVTKQSLLSEIRICFDRSLQMKDCDVLDPNLQKQNGVLTNCKSGALVMYYTAKVEPPAPSEPDSDSGQGVYIGLFISFMFCLIGVLAYVIHIKKRKQENYTNFQ